MESLNPEKLTVKFKAGVTPVNPIIPRRYTLTHSDVTAELFLSIGRIYALEEIGTMRDEVLAEWIRRNDQLAMNVYLWVGGKMGDRTAFVRNEIFRRELPLAFQAIRYGDGAFFDEHEELNYAPIIVYFISSIPYLNRIENWGTPSDYEI